MNYQEILETLKQKIKTVDDFAMQDFKVKDLGLGPIKLIDEKGGEGEGEEWYAVFHFKAHDIYIKVNGYYTSYDGTEFEGGWGCCNEVTPKKESITVWEVIV